MLDFCCIGAAATNQRRTPLTAEFVILATGVQVRVLQPRRALRAALRTSRASSRWPSVSNVRQAQVLAPNC